jgi:ferredoxin-type protein NapH
MAIWKALLLTLPIVPFAFVPMLAVLMADPVVPAGLVAGLLISILFTAAFFRMMVTGKTHRYRSALFSLFAFAIPFHIIPIIVAVAGSMALTEEATYAGKAQFCPMTMPMVLLPALLKRVVVFPGVLAYGAAWFVVWIAVSLTLGRGWCSWICIYGGWDEFFSRLRKKAVIKHVDRRWRFLPFAVLLAIVLLSAITFHPIYCEWLCPFKVVSEFEAPTSLRTQVALGIFPLAFAGLVVALPLLTKKRIQCALFCPFGALQQFFNKISIFELRIDLDKCSQCKRCLRECPTFSLDESSLVSGKALMSCTKCGQCVDACPKGAMTYHIKGTSVDVRSSVARLLYVYPAYMFLAAFGGTIITEALLKIYLWITTGNMMPTG